MKKARFMSIIDGLLQEQWKICTALDVDEKNFKRTTIAVVEY